MRSLANVFAQLEKVGEIKTSPRQLFTYVPFPEDIRQRFEQLAKHVVPGGRVARDIDHVTLLYIPKAEADVAQERVDEILCAMRDVCEHVRPIKAKVQGWGYFDGALDDGVSKTALVGLIDAPGLEDLHVELKQAMRRLGLKDAGTHIFTPHVTFAYLEKGERVKDLPLLDGEFEIDRIMFANADKHEVKLLGHKSLGEKAAEASQEEEEKPTIGERFSGWGKRTGPRLARQAITNTANKAMNAGLLSLMDATDVADVPAAAQPAMLKDLAKRIGVKAPKHIGEGAAGFHPYGAPEAVERRIDRGLFPFKPDPSVRLPKDTSEAIMAHELGHARTHAALGPVGSVAFNVPRALSRFSHGPALVYSAMAEDPSYWPSMIHLGLSTPTLLDELAASAQGVKALVGKHGLGRGLRLSASLAPAFGTYALHAGLPAGVVALRRYLANRGAESDDSSLGKEAAMHFGHQMAMGLKVEQEHNKDPKQTRQIVLDHLREDPEYYSKLKKCMPEKQAERVDRCKVCDKPATVKVLWAEGHGYQPACEAHKEQVAKPFKDKDDFSGFRRYKKASALPEDLLQRLDARLR